MQVNSEDRTSIFVSAVVKKVKLSRYRPWAGPWGSRRLRISRQSAHEGGKVVSPTHRPPLPPPLPSKEKFLVLISVRR
jgi:hypothetical protein